MAVCWGQNVFVFPAAHDCRDNRRSKLKIQPLGEEKGVPALSPLRGFDAFIYLLRFRKGKEY